MKIKTFIDRPVLSSVISVLIVIGGLIGLAILPIERYPNIAPPTINVNTTYTGASAETVQKSVVVPLEEAINGVENMTYMYSTATNNGSASVRVYFKQGTDPDMAAVNVQNCVSRATRQLPSEVTEVGVTVRKRQTNILEQIALYSPNGTYDRTFIVNYIKINLVPEISRIPGVGDIEVRGSDYSMRIWLKPDVMAQYKLIPSDIKEALNEQNIEAATGSFGENADQTFQYAMRYKGRLEKPDEFENIVIRALPNGELLRLKDVADIELGTQSYLYVGEVNHSPGTSFSVYQTPGSNATEVINRIDAFMEEASKDFPTDLEAVILSSSNDFLYASIKNVARTLIEAIILVTLVVFVFLRSIRSTLIPLICTLVSIIGTFMFLYIFGFSINLLTLFALVLSIGVVVDDAIIVVEAVHARFDAGYVSPYKAAVHAMDGITAAVITSTLVFMAVFIPVSLIGGTSGSFYTQFGITMAVSVGISAINALTLSPALCSLFLRPKDASGKVVKKSLGARMGDAFESAFQATTYHYLKSVSFFLRRPWIAFVLIVGVVGLLAYYMQTTKTGLIPKEDIGTMRIDVSTPPGSSLSYTKGVMDRIDREIVQDIPEARAYLNMTGFGMTTGAGSSNGNFTIRLKPWDERPGKEHSVDAIMNRVKEYASSFNDASIFTTSPAMIPGYGATNGFEIYIQDRKGGNIYDLADVTNTFLARLKERPEIGSAHTSFNPRYPQYQLDVDAVKCKRAGLSPKEVLSVLNGYYGGSLSTKFNRFTKLYQVVVQADPKYRVDQQTLNNIFVRIGTEMAPISQFIRLNKIYAPENLSRFNMFPCIGINGRAADGCSSGDAIRAIRETAEETLPVGYGFDFAGISREEAQSGNNTIFIFIVCIVLIYLILCALYESYFIPFSIILSVPFGLIGSFMFARWMGLENNIYLQTGLIMLIGLLSKTAILITEYAVTRRENGMGLAEAAFNATKERFRPIMMTVLTMVFGMLPLMFSTGVGANGNNTLGAGVVGGMIIGTIALLLIVPSLFIVFQKIEEFVVPPSKKKERKEAL
ncbi:MAG: efflux RND transporter permease subunit [Alistipes sp.]|nr:efflux RND transporter permease subunit [Candidatus Alistipes equi]